MNLNTFVQIAGLAATGLLSIWGVKYGSKSITPEKSLSLQKRLFIGIVLSTVLASTGKLIESQQLERDKSAAEKKNNAVAEQNEQLLQTVKRLEKPFEIKTIQSQYEIDIENEYLGDYAEGFRASVESLTRDFKGLNGFAMPIPHDNSVVVGRSNTPEQILFRSKTNLLPKDVKGHWMLGNCIWKIKIFKHFPKTDADFKSPDLQLGHNTTIYSRDEEEVIHGSIVYDLNLQTFSVKTDEVTPRIERHTGIVNGLVDLQGAFIYIEPFGGWTNTTTRITYLRLLLPNGQRLMLTKEMFQSVQQGRDLYLFHRFEQSPEMFRTKYLS